jgi:flagellar transcriptional activator FlhC
MDTALIDQRVRALATARACAAFGARPKTVHHLTGLRTQEIQRLLFTHRGPHLRGRAPDTPEWFHRANLPSRCEASIVVVSFLRIRSMGFSGTDALIEAYRYYRSMHPAPSRISFDRAFDLVAHSTGLWFARCASFCTSWCPHCHAEYLGALGGRSTAPSACPFCQILRRYDRDPRLTTDYLPPPPPDDQVFSAWGLVGSTGYGATPAC